MAALLRAIRPESAKFERGLVHATTPSCPIATRPTAASPALKTGLHRFAKRWYRLRALRVFLESASLSANPGLWASIERALHEADNFLLLASPEAKASPWVAREALWWREHRPMERFLVLLTEGAIVWNQHGGDFDWDRTNAVPESLAGAFDQEPRWIDIRWARTAEDVSLHNPRFRAAVRRSPRRSMAGRRTR